MTNEAGWQPIETAPRDGRELIGAHWSRCGRIFISVIQRLTAEQIADAECGDPAEFTGDWDADGDQSCATHWMPLPPAPEANSAGKEGQ